MRASLHTFPFMLKHQSRAGRSLSPMRRRVGRGFTLIEMMVVVLIIALSAAIAIPGIMNRMKSNRTKMAAEQLAIYFRLARLRAVGRSSAVVVRYNAGVVTLLEAIQGATATPGCNRLPQVSCTLPANRWTAGNPGNQPIDGTDFVFSGDFALTVTDSTGANPAAFDVCFAPSGRTFFRDNTASPFAPWTNPIRVDVERTDGIGFQRSVLVVPTGSAKVVASP